MNSDLHRDDTAFVQERLDKRGLVVFGEPAVYVIKRTLVIHSGTRLLAAPGVVFLAAPESRCSLIENEHFAGGARDADIVVEGGVWDGNSDNQGLDAYEETEERNRINFAYDPAVFKGKLIRFAHVDNITLEKMTVKNPVSYGVQIADADNFIVRDIHFNYNCHFGTTDGIHINGPSQYGLIENCTGVTNDDMVSLTTDDEAHAEVTRGPIHTVEIRNISAENGYSGIRLLSSGNPMWDIHISGVYGTYRHNAVLVSHHNVHRGEPIWFDDITIEHVHASKSSTPLQAPCFLRWENNCIERLPLVHFYAGIQMGHVTVRDLYRHETSNTKAPLLLLEKTVKIARLNVENVSQTCSEGVELPLAVNQAEIGELVTDVPGMRN